MLTKILLTLAVIGGALLALQLRNRPGPQQSTQRKPPLAKKWFKLLSVVVITLMVAAAGVFVYIEWQQANEVLQVEVIDSRTGQIKEYRVLRGNLQERSFQTTDGRFVRLAETDRMEVLSER